MHGFGYQIRRNVVNPCLDPATRPRHSFVFDAFPKPLKKKIDIRFRKIHIFVQVYEQTFLQLKKQMPVHLFQSKRRATTK